MKSQGRGVTRAAVLLLVLFGVVLVPASAAWSAEEAPDNYARFGPDGSETSDFDRINSVAIDQASGDVYVLDGEAGALYKFDAKGEPLGWGGNEPYISGNRISGLTPFTGRNEAQLAVNGSTHVVFVTEQHSIRAFREDGEPAEFSAGPGAGTNEIPGFTELHGLAVDSSGDFYASDFATGMVSVYDQTGSPLTTFSATAPGNLAVDSVGRVYVVNSTFPASVTEFTPTDFPVTSATTYAPSGTLELTSGSAPVGVATDPATNDVYIIETTFAASWLKEFDAAGTFIRYIAKPAEEEAGLGNFAQGVAPVDGNVRVQFYVGNSQLGTAGAYPQGYSKVEIFGEEINEDAPTVTSLATSEVTADSATLETQINSNTSNTTYWFEYGAEPCASGHCTVVPLGGGNLPAGHKPVSVSAAVSGLQPATTYYYRVVAENSFGVTISEERQFTSQGAGLVFRLSDDRAWEMVSPPVKGGGRLVGSEAGLIQASADGNGLAYLSLGSILNDPEGNRAEERSSVLARRMGTEWKSMDITPPNSRISPLAVGMQGEYKLFGPDLSKALLEPRSGTPLSPEASERTPYLRINNEPPVYTPLVTGREGFANVPAGTEFGGDPEHVLGEVTLAGANRSLSHVALVSEVPLVLGAPPHPEPSLYLWSAGQLQAVSVLPPAEGGTIVPAKMVGSGAGSIQNAVSDDGSRIVWSVGEYTSVHSLTALYMHNVLSNETVRLDVVQPGASGAGEASPVFQGASSDGTAVFFTDSQQLTADASPSGRDLYRCEISFEIGTEGCSQLVDISAPVGAGSSEVQGLVAGLSNDADRVYFVARGVLDSDQGPTGETAAAGKPNLYYWEEGAGVAFIAVLSKRDSGTWGGQEEWAIERTAAASPDGRYLSFLSQRSLTGYDNHLSAGGEPVGEVFRYDAVADRLDCLSCDTTESLPRGARWDADQRPRIVDPRGALKNQWVAAALPEPTLNDTRTKISMYQPRSVLNNGRVFFNAIDSLVPADSNRQWDVYEYEPVGMGSCSTSASSSSEVNSAGGCISLISSGSGEEEAGLLDASESGDDAFFLTTAQLNEPDRDRDYDVYDARVGGVPATLPLLNECLGEACQQGAQAPNDETPASSAYRGRARKHCPKGRRRVKHHHKIRCMRKPHKHQHRRKGHHTSKSGRAAQ